MSYTEGYVETAESLGGGSVGRAPFWLHDESCDPPNGTEAEVDPSAGLASVRLRHYGPVFWNGDPVAVQRRPACTDDAWEDVTDEMNFQVPADGDQNSVSVTGQSPHFEVGYEYQMMKTDQLLCDEVNMNPEVDWDDLPYSVVVRSSCPADLDADGMVAVTDLLEVLGTWGTAVSNDPVCNGVIDIADLLAVLGTWGLCPLASGTPDPPPEEVAEEAGLTQQQWEDAVEIMMDPETSQAVRSNYACWLEHYFDCHRDPFCVDCGCVNCPDDDPFGGH